MKTLRTFLKLLIALPALCLAASLATSPATAAPETAPAYELDIEAMIAIRFYNTYEPMLWAGMHITEDVEKNILNADSAIQDPESTRGSLNWHHTGVNNTSTLSEPVRVPNFFTKADIATLRDTSDKFKTTVQELVAHNNSLTKYFDDGQNKTDQNKKYLDARPRLIEQIKETRTHLDAFNEPALKLAQAGEARTLPKNPCGPFILHMREVLDVTDQISPLIANDAFLPRDPYTDRRNKRAPETAGEKTARMTLAKDTAAKLDALCDQIATLAAKYKDTPTDPVTQLDNPSAKETCLRVWKSFFTDRCPSLIKETQEHCATLRSEGTIGDTRRLLSILSSLTGEHDEFVDMYNNWAGGDQAVKRGEAS